MYSYIKEIQGRNLHQNLSHAVSAYSSIPISGLRDIPGHTLIHVKMVFMPFLVKIKLKKKESIMFPYSVWYIVHG